MQPCHYKQTMNTSTDISVSAPMNGPIMQTQNDIANEEIVSPCCLLAMQGYVTAWCEEEGVLGMVLLKYFGKEMKEDWTREVDVVQGLSGNEDPQDNLLHYRWHSKGK